jgi:glycosyltransferase involved in cell wall biosynthesis
MVPEPATMARPIKVAIVHEWLTCLAGSERVLEQLLKVYPQAEIFCLVDYLEESDRGFLEGKTVNTSFLQKLPFGRILFRKLPWLMPCAIESFDMSPFDVILSSSHAVAKGAITGPDQLHICYCHSPIRYAWDMQHEYLRQAGLTTGFKSIYARLTLHYLRIWDIRTANGVDCFIANSRFIAKRIEKTYRRNAIVIHPPVDVDRFQPNTPKEDFYLSVSRLVPYKRADLIIEAFSKMPSRRLIMIGDGPSLSQWKKNAAQNIEFLGYQDDATVSVLMAKARAFVFAAEEDFGITVVEAQAAGTPVICFGRGGVLDSVIPGITGIFFPEQTSESIQEAVATFESTEENFRPEVIRAHAERFSQQRFRDRIERLVAGQLKNRRESDDAEPEWLREVSESQRANDGEPTPSLGRRFTQESSNTAAASR